MKTKAYIPSRLKGFFTALLTVFCLLSSMDMKAQLYPVSTNVSSMPPLSMYLNDYGIGNNLQVSLIERDVMGEPFEAYLNIELEGGGIKLKTMPSFRPSTYIDIVPTVMVTLTNSDLAEYFNVNSLSFEGISKESFNANGQQLPEGLYYLRIKAMHRFRGQQISNESMTLLRLQKGQPPIINQPMEKEKVAENPMQNFNINWTVRNINPMSMPSYRLQMWEMLDPNQDPNIIANSNYPPILDEYTNFTTFQYGLSQTPLTAGKSYVIRVQVLDPEGRDVYANSGFSQVRKFTYGDPCDPPTKLTAIQDSRGIQVNWALTPNQGGYRLQYGRIDTAWTDADMFINRFSIEKIYPSAQYQMRVSALCSAGKQSDYSEIVYIGTNPTGSNNNSACGDPFPKIDIKNKKLLPTLNVGDKFTSFDFDITVTRVIRNDSNSYAGEGKTPFNMLGGVNVVCYFDGIQINTDRQHINEVPVRFQQKPYVFSDKNVKKFKEDFKETQERMTGNDAANPTSVSIDVTIGSVVYDSTQKQIVINDASGNSYKTLTSGKDYKITDKDGNVYLVSKDNKVSKQPKATETTVKGGNPVKDGGENYDIHFAENQPILFFEAHPQQTWGFDAEPMNTMVKTFYESIINTQRAYYVPYKSVGSAGTDKVVAKVAQNPENVDLTRIKFKTNAGVVVPFTYDASKEEWTLTLTAGLHRNDFSVFPYYTGNGKDTLCGKLNVMPLDKKEVNLVLVPLNGFNKANINVSNIETYLNTVYHQANIAYKVSLENAFSSASADEPLSVEHGTLEGEYSVNQANVIADYTAQHPEQDNTIYLFLCKEGSNDAIKGHTPINRSYGFIFGENLDKRTIAHEVGHGYPLALEHPFTTGGATGTFSNLMDYASDVNLSYLQWGGAHNPKLKVRFGQSSGVGQMLADKLYYRPDGKIFISTALAHENMPVDKIQSGLYPNGAIYDFKLDGIYYAAVIVDNKFKGYYQNGVESQTRYAPELDYQKINKESLDKGIPIEVIYTKSVSKCTWERIKTTHKTLTDLDVLWPNEGEGSGYPLATAIPMQNAKVYQTGRFDKCEDLDEEAEPAKGTLGYTFYASNSPYQTDEDKLYLKKTGNIMNKLGPGIYDAFYKRVQADARLDKYGLLEAMLIAWQLTKKDKDKPWKDIYESIKLFSDGVDGLKNKTFANRAELLAHCNMHFMNQAPNFKYFFDQPFALLTTDRRNQLLSLYKGVSANQIDGRGGIDEILADKDMINALIKHASVNDGKKLLDHLYKENILAAVIESFDSYFYGGMDELSELIANLNRIQRVAYPISTFETDLSIKTDFDYINQDRFLLFDDNYLGRTNSEGISSSSSDLMFSVEPLHPLQDQKEYKVFCKPYTYIMIKFLQDVEFGGTKFTANTSHKIPSLMVYLLFSKNTRDKIMKSAEIAVDVGSLALGVGALNVAVRTARVAAIAYETFELANDVVGITVNSYEADIKTQYPRFYKNWQTYSRYYGLGKLSTQLTGADGAIKELIGEEYFEARKIVADPNAASSAKAFAAQLEVHLKDDYPDFIDEVNQYLIMTRKKFDPSFSDKMDDLLVDHIRNKLSTEQIARLNDEIKAKPSFLDDLNAEPKKLDEWANPVRTRHQNWVEVLDIRNKVLAKMPHVLRMDINANNTGFKGCHSIIALQEYVSRNPTARFEFRNKIMDGSNNGVYEANPVVVLSNGSELVKTNNRGKSTFFPNDWDENKILEEVEYAISNNHGHFPGASPTEYYGFSSDGNVEIHFYLSSNGIINSYFPVKN